MVPILITAWKRPEKVQKLLNAVSQYKPTKLYISCDGPNKDIDGQKEKVAETRLIIENSINWECQVFKNYSEFNRGCRDGMSNAIDWFFSMEEEGIILEDDCLPHPDFFAYCEELLEKFRYDERIFSISGCNLQNGIKRGEGSYYFSRYSHVWGWAAWRRSWKYYDKNLSQWDKVKTLSNFDSFFVNNTEKIFWTKIFDNLKYHGIPDTWDFQWSFTHFLYNKLTIIPNVNLINNIGFDSEATHTLSSPPNTKIDKNLLPLKHPKFIIRDKSADEYFFKNHVKLSFLKKIINIFKNRLWNHIHL